MELDRCSGHCCMNLGIEVSPEALERSYLEWKASPYEKINMTGIETKKIPAYHEIWLLYPMLQFLYADNIHPDGEAERDDKIYHYKCKNFIDGNCSIYAHRPNMCSSFGNDNGCGYKECTWKAAKEKREVIMAKAKANAEALMSTESTLVGPVDPPPRPV